MLTLKFKIKHNYISQIIEYQRQYSILLHYAFNYMNRQNKLDSLFNYQKGSSKLITYLKSLQNIDLMNSWFIQCAVNEAYQMIKNYQIKIDQYNQKIRKKDELLNKQKLNYIEKKQLKQLNKLKYPKVIFGGRKNFINRIKHKITKDQFKLNKLSPLYSIGTAKPYKGNQKFRISSDLQNIIFQPKCKLKYWLKLIGVSKGYKDILSKLYIRQQNKDLPITFKLSNQYIYISFDQKQLYKDQFNYQKIKDRYLAIDLNPNYIGYVIIDWVSSDQFNIIDKGVYSFKQLNNIYNDLNKRKYLTNKRHYQIIEVAKNLINKCLYYKVQNFIIEDLNIPSKDLFKGTNLNRLINNQWIRRDFINNIKKKCNIFKINYLEILPQYSSFTGNIIFRSLNLPDQILSSIQLSRRGYQFRHQYILKNKPLNKNIVKIDINNDKVYKDLFIKSVEVEFNIKEHFKDIIDCYYYFKRNSKLLYRVSLDNYSSYFREFSTKQSRLLINYVM